MPFSTSLQSDDAVFSGSPRKIPRVNPLRGLPHDNKKKQFV